MSKLDYTTLPHKVSKEVAVSLLTALRKDIRKMQVKKQKAIIWAYDIQHLTFNQIADALGYASKTTVLNTYYKMKGGEHHE